MPRRKTSAAPVSPELPKDAPAKRRGRAKTKIATELSADFPPLENNAIEQAPAKKKRGAPAGNQNARIKAAKETLSDPLLAEPKRKRGAPKGNQNAKGNKGVPGNKHALGKSTGRKPLFPVTDDMILQIKKLSSIACTQREAASFLDMDEDYFEGILRSSARARKAWDNGGPAFNVSLRRKNVEVAMTGNVQMLKFLSINRLGMVDKVEHSGDPDRPIKAEMTFKVEFVKNAIGADQYSTAGGF